MILISEKYLFKNIGKYKKLGMRKFSKKGTIYLTNSELRIDFGESGADHVIPLHTIKNLSLVWGREISLKREVSIQTDAGEKYLFISNDLERL